MGLHKLICARCNADFVHLDARTKYCSKECSKPKLMVTCDVCGVSSHRKKSHVKNNINNFCTKLCMNSVLGRELLERTIKKTSESKYSESNYSKTNEFKVKSKTTQILKYGDLYVRTKEYTNKKEDTCLRKFGVTDAMRCDEIKNKVANSNRSNRYEEFSLQIRQKQITLLSSKESFIKGNISYKCNICNNIWDSTAHNLQHVFCESNICQTRSVSEHEIFEFIKNNCKSEVSTQVRITIGDKQLTLDLVIEELKLVVEYHGLYWHTSKFRHNMYHRERYKTLTEIGYTYIQILGHEWDNRKEAVKGIILNKLGKQSQIVYARKMEMREVSNGDYHKFMGLYHIQGTINAKIKLGLYYNDVCVQMVSFSEYEDRWECARLCTRSEFKVVGGFNKLMNAFVKIKNDDKDIISYINLRYFSGEAYLKSGFSYLGDTKPGYFYTNGNKVLSRQKCQKHKLGKLLTNYDPLLTEEQNMCKNKFYRLYDSGNGKMLWKKK